MEATDDEVVEAAKTVCAHDFIMQMEDGYHTQVNEREAAFRRQRQLISFARALLADPKILILDEATSSIDTETEIILQEVLARLLKAEPPLSLPTGFQPFRCPTAYVHRPGKILERGNHDDLMAKKGEYYKLFMSSTVSLWMMSRSRKVQEHKLAFEV